MERTKDEVVKLVDAAGPLKFVEWYKNSLKYENKEYVVDIIPEYRDCLVAEETLEDMLTCEDYTSVNVFKGKEKPWEWEWCKDGDDS